MDGDPHQEEQQEAARRRALRAALRRRLHILERQQIAYGLATPAYIMLEIEDARRQIGQHDARLAAAADPPEAAADDAQAEIAHLRELLEEARRRAQVLARPHTPHRLQEIAHLDALLAGVQARAQALQASLGSPAPQLAHDLSALMQELARERSGLARPAEPAPARREDFDYQRGLRGLRDRLAGQPEALKEFLVLESRMRAALRSERLYGSSETVRHDLARITDELNRIAQEHVGVRFNALAMGDELEGGN